MYQDYFFFWSCLFDILYVSYPFTGIYFYRLRKFSSIILLKIFLYILPDFVSFLYLLFIDFIFSLCSRFSGCCVPHVSDLIFSLTKLSISSMMSSVPDSLSHISCILCIRLSSEVPCTNSLILHFQISLSFSFSYWFYFQIWVYSFSSTAYLCFHRFLYRISFSTYCRSVAELLWYTSSWLLLSVFFVSLFVLQVSRHLCFGWL